MAAKRKRGRPAGTRKCTGSERKERKRQPDRGRSREKISVGEHFERWNKVKDELNLRYNYDVAGFLLERYEESLLPHRKSSYRTSLMSPQPEPPHSLAAGPLPSVPVPAPSCPQPAPSHSTPAPVPVEDVKPYFAESVSTVQSSSAWGDRPLPQEDAASTPVEIEVVLTKSMINKPVAGSHADSRDVLKESFITDSVINLSGTRYTTLTKERFVRLMFRCLECSSECRIRGKGRNGDLTFRQECLTCSNYRVWTSQAADIPDIKNECLPCGDAHELPSDCMPVTVGEEHILRSSKPTHKGSAKASEDSYAVRDKQEKDVIKEEKLSFLMETHEDNSEDVALVRDQTSNPTHLESSDTNTATKHLFVDEIAEKESGKSSEKLERDNFDMYHLISSDKDNLSADKEIFTDEDRCEEFVKEASDESFENAQKVDSDEYLPNSSDTESSASSGDETSDNVKTKKPFQNTIKPVIWCIDCGSVAKVFCKVKRHKRNYCCAECVSVDYVENLSFKDFSVYFNDITSFHVHAIAEHRGSEKFCKHKICQDCNKNIRVETDPNKRGHVCEYKIKPFSCDLCPKRFIRENGRKLHYQRVHGEYQHTCRYCMQEFNTKQSKLEHEEVHRQETLYYTCPNCPKRFTNFHARNTHLKTHPKKKHFCSICNRKFNAFYIYERHLRIHSGEKPYKCDVCERSFTQAGHLKSHRRVHTGEKPFLCEHCGESFNHNISLRRHRQRKHGITAFSSVQGEENKQIGRPIRNEVKLKRQREISSDAEVESCAFDKEQKKRGRKRKFKGGEIEAENPINVKLSSVQLEIEKYSFMHL